MRILTISLNLLIVLLFTIFEIQADSSACEQKEKHIAVLDLAKGLISKAKDDQPGCVSDSKDASSNSSECGAKETAAAYLDIANNLIEIAKESVPTCDKDKNITKEEKKEELKEEKKEEIKEEKKEDIIPQKAMDCSEIKKNGQRKSGEYEIFPKKDGPQLKVYCDMETDGGGWTLIQRRGNYSKKTDFFRTWTAYRHGFGNISEEFWIGNDNIFALTNRTQTLRFDMKNAAGEHRFATYSSFWVDDAKAGYKMHFDKYAGTAGDGINTANNKKFSTKDKENNQGGCAASRNAGWWYNYCGETNPNGLNVPGGRQMHTYMNWFPWTAYDSLLSIEIKIRPEN